MASMLVTSDEHFLLFSQLTEWRVVFYFIFELSFLSLRVRLMKIVYWLNQDVETNRHSEARNSNINFQSSKKKKS